MLAIKRPHLNSVNKIDLTLISAKPASCGHLQTVPCFIFITGERMIALQVLADIKRVPNGLVPVHVCLLGKICVKKKTRKTLNSLSYDETFSLEKN